MKLKQTVNNTYTHTFKSKDRTFSHEHSLLVNSSGDFAKHAKQPHIKSLVVSEFDTEKNRNMEYFWSFPLLKEVFISVDEPLVAMCLYPKISNSIVFARQLNTSIVLFNADITNSLFLGFDKVHFINTHDNDPVPLAAALYKRLQNENHNLN